MMRIPGLLVIANFAQKLELSFIEAIYRVSNKNRGQSKNSYYFQSLHFDNNGKKYKQPQSFKKLCFSITNELLGFLEQCRP